MSVNSSRLIGFGRKTNSNLTVAPIAVTVTANTATVNLFTLAGSPAGVVTVNCTINSGVYCYASTTGNYGFRTGTFTAGSTINIINNGFITGQGGGGRGANQNGYPAGSAFLAEVNCNISGTGQINGGGGGGGSGASGPVTFWPGGGGGGRSFLNSAGGSDYPTAGLGSPGTVSGGGAGGGPEVGCGRRAGGGGTGGNWGANGGDGGYNSDVDRAPGFGGAGGISVVKNGKTVSITGVTTNGAITA